MKCPKCQSHNREGAKFCIECGEIFKKTCPSCNKALPLSAKFCDECGHGCQSPDALSVFKNEIQDQKVQSSIENADLSIRVSNGERKQVTALFTDLSGYTAMSEKLDPEEIKEITIRIFGQISKIITKYDGFIEKYVGDAVMAMFGATVAHEDDPVRAIMAARDIHEMVDSVSLEMEKTIGQPISIHTGINTGLVITGDVDMEKGTHGVSGDPINLASRVCNLANSNEILVGPLTHRQSEGHFNFAALEPARIKGKAESVNIYQVLSAKKVPLSIHRISGLRAKLIGRTAEMEKLGEALRQLRDGKGTVFSIYGDAGTGKSRLVEEFKATLDLKEIQWREGHAYPYSHNIPYFPLINLLKGAFHIEEGDSQKKIKKKIESSVENLVSKKEDVLHYIESLFSLSHPALEQVSPDFWKVQLKKAIHTILLALTQRAPTVIFLDDLHWGDPSSIELLRSLLAEFRYRAIFLCAYRPPFSLFPSNLVLGMRKVYQELPLHDLSISETQDMLQSLLQTKDIPFNLGRFVQEKVEGNPFYLEEIINDLIESDTLLNENGMWTLTKPITRLDISSTIHGIISARVDRLEKGTKRVLQEASVIGRTFLYEILKKATTQKDKLESHIDVLKRFDLIRIKSFQPDLEYSFKHAIIQEVVYNSLLKKERQEIHECIGRVMENLFKKRLAEFYETISFHFMRGKSLHKAIGYLMQSGMKSLKRYAVEEAHQYYKEAYDTIVLNKSEIGKDTGLLIELLNTWAPVFYYRGNFRDLEELLKKHLNQANALDDKEKLGMFYLWLGMSLWGRLRLNESYKYLNNALLLGEKSGSKRVIGYASAWLPWTCIELGLPQEAIAHGEKARQMYDYFKSDYYPYYQSLDCNGYAYWVLGDSEKLREHGNALLEYGKKNSSIRAVTWGHFVEGWSYMATGDFPSAIRCNKMAIEASADPLYSQFPKLSLGMSYVSEGQYDKAREPLEAVLRDAQSLGSEILGTASLAFLAVVLIYEGHFNRGMKILEEVQRQFLENNARWRYCFTELILGEIFLSIAMRKNPVTLSIILKNLPFLMRNIPLASRKAKIHYNRAIESAKEICAKGVQGQAYLGLGNLYMGEGKKDQASECIESAIQMFELCGAETFLRRANETRLSMS